MVDKDARKIQAMFAGIAPRYDLANRVLSMRLDVGWRRRVARTLLPIPGRVLDIAAGTGDLSLALHRWGGHEVVSADFTFEMLAAGREKIRPWRDGCWQLAADALSLPFADGAFDASTVAFGVRNFADPVAGLREMARVVRPGGIVGVLEFSSPSKVVGFAYRFYSKQVIPLIGGALTGSQASYRYLTDSVDEFPEGDRFLDLMEQAGLARAAATRLTGGIVTFYTGDRQ